LTRLSIELPLPGRQAISTHYIGGLRSESNAALGPPMEDVMRAEIQNIVDEIKQSVVLLRRHL
jgi:hypothetical protein